MGGGVSDGDRIVCWAKMMWRVITVVMVLWRGWCGVMWCTYGANEMVKCQERVWWRWVWCSLVMKMGLGLKT